jgi:hypothetical protein
MVKTRGGSAVIFTATSYGHASREETKRQCRKCKAQPDAGEGITTPRRSVTGSHFHLVDSLATPSSVSRAAVVTTPTQTTPLRPLHGWRREARCSNFLGHGWHYLFQAKVSSSFAPLVTSGIISLLMQERT